ncbi:hypothetical protein AcW1_005059 [Taiwanofungus camphoratus]|nr:hypothetical protein AcW2_005931 [Antrodia cinnamomea]KAI0941156.1 hypothetical protein AcV7_002798 [Antrodia cinnamomea]KAI0960580.1 hypothetical protein AcW1_005059 [Antrodia cinnamomea]
MGRILLYPSRSPQLVSVKVRHPCRRLSSTIGISVKPCYVTTPIFYPNSVPHIGHLHSLVIGDIFARYARLSDPSRPVRYVTGTDEHGLKIQKAAQARGMEPLAFCDELSEHFRVCYGNIQAFFVNHLTVMQALAKKADISHSYFARTSQHGHCDAVQHLWRELNARDLIYKGRHHGWYSVSDECFYPESQVTRKTDSEEEYYVSVETGSRVEWMEEENYKFRLSSFRSLLYDHFTKHNDAIYPPQHQADIVATLSSDKLEDLSVSRPRSRLTWGVPVPDDPEHTIYVWIDALTVYLSSVGYPWAGQRNGYQCGWPPDIQIIGKDILRFHAIYLPAMLAALNLPFPKRLLAHSHWTVDKHKMSKSIGNVADPIQAIDDFGTDVVRYYLARVGGRFRDDVDWSHEQLQKHSKEITSLLGNLYSRITSAKIQARVAGMKRPSVNAIGGDDALFELLGCTRNLSIGVHSNMQKLQVTDALEKIVATLQEANMLMSRTAPWAKSTSVETTLNVCALILEALRICGILLQPFMPSKAALLLDSLGIPAEQRALEHAAMGQAQVGEVQSGVLLFEMPQLKVKAAKEA